MQSTTGLRRSPSPIQLPSVINEGQGAGSSDLRPSDSGHQRARLQLESQATYLSSAAAIIQQQFATLGHPLMPIQEMVASQKIKDDLLRDPRVDRVEFDFNNYQDRVELMDPSAIDRDKISQAEEAILSGAVLMEHTAAGEATRLGMGPKYLITPADIATQAITHHSDRQNPEMKSQIQDLYKNMAPLAFGTRHMLQTAFAIRKMAEKRGQDPKTALQRQLQFVIASDRNISDVANDFRAYNFFGFSQENVYFMIQDAMHGFKIENGEIKIDPASELRLHNHGAMRMQQVMDHTFFRFDENFKRINLSFDEMASRVKPVLLSISYNIEDLDHLANPFNLPAIATGLQAMAEGYEMVMTAARQKVPPQKGGAIVWDGQEGRLFCIESDAIPEKKPEDIGLLNKNENKYNLPRIWDLLRNFPDLPLHPTFKQSENGHIAIYPQPPQGDLNFIAKTKFIVPTEQRPLRNLKDPNDLLMTLAAMAAQDKTSGFLEFVAALRDD